MMRVPSPSPAVVISLRVINAHWQRNTLCLYCAESAQMLCPTCEAVAWLAAVCDQAEAEARAFDAACDAAPDTPLAPRE